MAPHKHWGRRSLTCVLCLLVGWLAGWLVGWLVDWLFDWLGGWLATTMIFLTCFLRFACSLRFQQRCWLTYILTGFALICVFSGSDSLTSVWRFAWFARSGAHVSRAWGCSTCFACAYYACSICSDLRFFAGSDSLSSLLTVCLVCSIGRLKIEIARSSTHVSRARALFVDLTINYKLGSTCGWLVGWLVGWSVGWSACLICLVCLICEASPRG